jgi:hypothetical protein
MGAWCPRIMPGQAFGSSGVPQLFGDNGIFPLAAELLG